MIIIFYSFNIKHNISFYFAKMDNLCWICLEHCNVQQKCKCKNAYVHAECLARWQFIKAGEYEEHHCRFCDAKLDDWIYVLKPDYDKMPKKRINFSCIVYGKQINILIEPHSTISDFITQLKLQSGIETIDIENININFICKNPFKTEATDITFTGVHTFNAVKFCVDMNPSKSPDNIPTEQTYHKSKNIFHMVWENIKKAFNTDELE